jgi:hypothetical protein
MMPTPAATAVRIRVFRGSVTQDDQKCDENKLEA